MFYLLNLRNSKLKGKRKKAIRSLEEKTYLIAEIVNERRQIRRLVSEACRVVPYYISCMEGLVNQYIPSPASPQPISSKNTHEIHSSISD